ncbi:hypothetical protein CYMTET_29110 [Cymbomonas tetramitiformis]|uniref:Uncharacterized protein n=1 Tax=Cymbomonas tetramitiformis TaxID=36881 RepID=A0AAE0FLP0_9CHLO|nr:hypothetical protein CYMTET_29110 [Cymbomonas tetramitiformis]
MMRKLLQTGIVVLVGMIAGENAAVIFAVFVSVFAILVHQRYSPFKNDSMDDLCLCILVNQFIVQMVLMIAKLTDESGGFVVALGILLLQIMVLTYAMTHIIPAFRPVIVGLKANDGRRAWLCLCREIARHRKPNVSTGWLFEVAPAVVLVKGVDPAKFLEKFTNHVKACRKEVNPLITPEQIWGETIFIRLLNLRICRDYYKEFLARSELTTDGQRLCATGFTAFTVAVSAFYLAQTQEAGQVAERKRKDNIAALSASLLGGGTPTLQALLQLGLSPGQLGAPPHSRRAARLASLPRAARARSPEGIVAAAGSLGTRALLPGRSAAGRPRRAHVALRPRHPRVSRDARGGHQAECWTCGGLHFQRHCQQSGGTLSANQMNVLFDGTSLPDLEWTLDEAYASGDEQAYEDLLTLHSLEVVMPMSSDVAGGETLLLTATGEAEVDGGDGYSPEMWVIWLASGADEATYWQTLATYEQTYVTVMPDEDAPDDLHATYRPKLVSVGIKS